MVPQHEKADHKATCQAITPLRQAAPWQILHPGPHHHPATTTTAAFPAIRCQCGRRAVRRRSRPGHLRLRRSHFAMSSISPKFIPLIIKDIRFDNLLDPAYFATKRPFCPISSQVQQMSFFRVSYYQVFPQARFVGREAHIYTSTPEVWPA